MEVCTKGFYRTSSKLSFNKFSFAGHEYLVSSLLFDQIETKLGIEGSELNLLCDKGFFNLVAFTCIIDSSNGQ